MRIPRFEWLLTALLALLLCLLPNLAWASAAHAPVRMNLVPLRSTYAHQVDIHIVNLVHESVSRLDFYESRILVKAPTAISPSGKVRTPWRSVVYTVQPGDTLWQLAQRHALTVPQLKMENRLSSSMIYPGQRLIIESANAYFAKERTEFLHNAVARAIRAGVPTSLVPVYEAAAHTYHIPWTVLAAIHRVETNFALSGPIVSDCGAQGPMQFMPATFAEYGVTAPGQSGPPNINNVQDAIFSTAHMLSEDGYNRNPANAIFLYNHSSGYVQDVQATARSY